MTTTADLPLVLAGDMDPLEFIDALGGLPPRRDADVSVDLDGLDPAIDLADYLMVIAEWLATVDQPYAEIARTVVLRLARNLALDADLGVLLADVELAAEWLDATYEVLGA